MKVSRLYPNIQYSPAMEHCAFSLDVMVQLAEFERDESLGQAEEILRFTALLESTAAKLPTGEAVKEAFPWDQWSACQQFTGLKETIAYSGEGSRISINHQSFPYAPAMSFVIDTLFLKSDLHNCATAPLAIVMYMHGLKALKTIYKAYNLPVHFLPDIGFEKRYLVFEAPFPAMKCEKPIALRRNIDGHLRDLSYPFKLFPETEPYGEFSIEGIKVGIVPPEQGNEAKFVGRIPFKGRDTVKRCEIGVHAFNVAVMQASVLYYIDDKT